MHDSLTQALLAGNLLLIAFGTVFCCIKRYELAVLLVVLSPWFSTIFVPNVSSALVEEEGSMGGYLRIGLLALMGGVGLFKYWELRSYHQEKLPAHIILLGLFLLIALASRSYSIDQYYTTIRALSFILLFGFLLGLNSFLTDRNKVNVVLQIMFVAICICLLINLVSLVIFPGKVWAWNNSSRFQGLSGRPNTFGTFCMVAYPILLWKYSHCKHIGKWLVAFAIVVFVLLHLLTGSRTTLLASILGVFVWFLVLKKKGPLIITVAVISVLALTALSFNPSSFERGDDASTLTGRPEFWKASLTLAMEKPIIGYGYGVSGKIFEDLRFYSPELSLWRGSAKTSLHNGYISEIVGLGVVGLLLSCAVLFRPLWLSMKARADEHKAFVIAIMLMCLVTNFFESAIIGGANILSTVFWPTWVVAGKILYIDTAAPGKDNSVLEQNCTG